MNTQEYAKEEWKDLEMMKHVKEKYEDTCIRERMESHIIKKHQLQRTGRENSKGRQLMSFV